ncbi:MAG: PAS domain-containing protein [Gammaproteobacteria bacterium]|nr:PAS domain-containing protein [Gammaproteobacteria bacterium]
MSRQKKNKREPTMKKSQTKPPLPQLYITGIGASAGGLEAFSTFFNTMPKDSGIAFVVVAHLDPEHNSLLPELIQKKTQMKVYQVLDNMKIEANSVYIIPPKKEIAILNGKLQLLEMEQPHGFNRPIDTFFRSLAQDQGHNSIAIILSGTGSDGTLGLRSIKGEAGLVMVQDAESSKYDGMPLNAIATGLVDYVLPPDKMPEQLIKYVNHLKMQPTGQLSVIDESIVNSLHKIYVLLRAQTDHDFSLYKKNTICRRIERRMHVQQIDNIENYVRYLQENENEVSILFKELLIGVTNFFRDSDAYDVLKTKYLPNLLENKSDEQSIRIWLPGCSTGEEVYSIAIILQECMENFKRHFSVQIFGTDIDEEAIYAARTGIYPESITEDVSSERLKKYFTKEDNQYQIKKSIREMVIFAPQNVIKDPPFTKLDLLCCRNLLIYFGAELQKKLLPIFHYSLKSGGILFLGSSETVGPSTDMFEILDKKWKIFRRLPNEMTTQSTLNFSTPIVSSNMPNKTNTTIVQATKEINSLNLLKTILSQSDMSARIVIDSQANIIYIHGRTGHFLEPAEGAITNNVIEMARSGLKAGLSNAIRQLTNSGKDVQVKGLQVKDNGGYLKVNLHLKPLPDFQSDQHGLMMVIFEELPVLVEKNSESKTDISSSDKNEEFKRLEDELQYTKENLQSTIEELETSNEEMKSTNEELQSTNEELQSTNEELETSKEELQSLNEESTTVNAELQSRIDELISAKDDIKNLLDATEIAAVFLDINLGIRRFTPKVVSIFPLTKSDLGRPIKHFASNLVDINLHDYAEQVLNDLSMIEEEVKDKDDTIYRMSVRPYRTINNVIDGIVITFEDITKIKKIESEINTLSSDFEERLLMMSKVFMEGADPIIIEDLQGKIMDMNIQAIESYGWTREELLGQSINKLIPKEYQKESENQYLNLKNNKKAIRNIKSFRQHKTGKKICVLLTLSLLSDLKGNLCAIASTAKITSG